MNILSLRHHLKQEIFPSWLAIAGPFDDEDERCFQVGSRVMKWSEDIFLVSLEKVLPWWRWMASRDSKELLPFFESWLPEHFGEDFRFCFAHHPWQAVVALRSMPSSFICLGTPQDDQAWKNLDWNAWKRPLEELRGHLPEKDRGDFLNMCGRWERFTDRMKVSHPFDLESLAVDSVERRFGKWWGRLWQWSFESFRKKEEFVQTDLFSPQTSAEFPWHDSFLREPPSVKRFFESPLLEWDHMEAFFQEDMQKILKNNPWVENVKVTRIDWEVTLENFKTHQCSLSFRNPYDLALDAPTFKTALFQGYYSYLEMMKAVAQREDDLDYPMKLACIGWRLTLSESLETPALGHDFLDDQTTSLGQRLALENKLPAGLESFHLLASFYPETSFCLESGDKNTDFGPWLAAATKRPLFLLKEMEPFSFSSRYPRRFLERVSSLWWQVPDPLRGERDYYIIEDEKKRLWWVFRNHKGKWYKHGIFS